MVRGMSDEGQRRLAWRDAILTILSSSQHQFQFTPYRIISNDQIVSNLLRDYDGGFQHDLSRNGVMGVCPCWMIDLYPQFHLLANAQPPILITDSAWMRLSRFAVRRADGGVDCDQLDNIDHFGPFPLPTPLTLHIQSSYQTPSLI